jgi:DNA replication protein DnaC
VTRPYAAARQSIHAAAAENVGADGGTGTGGSETGLCLAACRQKRRVRFTTAAALVNELVEAKQNNQVRRLMARWQRYELIAVDEVGYVPLADIGAEFLFQVISERAERAAIVVTTNCHFRNGRRCFRIRDYARHCSTASRIGRTSLRPGRNHFDSGAR